jgi:mono/diheme cytochrome c family protein
MDLLLTNQVNGIGDHPVRRQTAALPLALGRLAIGVTLAVVFDMSSLGLLAQAATRTVWDGVFTSGQAARGRQLFAENCAACHGENLEGGSAVTLSGPRFIADWSEDSLGSLFNSISRNMPRGRPGSLPDTTYADIVAYILEKNGFPPGAEELQVATLSSVRVEGRDGPGPVPDFSLISVVGCLIEASPRQWLLVAASEPVRTRNPQPSAEPELSKLRAMPPGTHSFALIDVFPSPALHSEQQVEVKGFLIRRPDQDRVNVTSIAALEGSCRK